MATANRTPWMTTDVRPVRPGWYEVKGACLTPNEEFEVNRPRASAMRTRTVMRFWTGEGWQWRHRPGDRELWGASVDGCVWRGLTKEGADHGKR